MAYQRLVVHRSPPLVWFGALALVALFALWQASYPSFEAMLRFGRWWLWVAPFALAGYCLFRGLYGGWGRELKIDREARILKLPDRSLVKLEELGPLSIKDRALWADNVKVPLYQSPFEYELVHLRLALDDLLLRGEHRRFYRLRRLTVHRAWGLFVFTLIGFALLTFAIGENVVYGGSDEIEYKLLALAGYAVCFTWFRHALFGSNSKHQLFVDPTAGLLRLENGSAKALADLGALSIVERKQRYTGRRGSLSEFDLRAANVEAVLFTEYKRARVQLRLDALATAILQSELRRVLEAPTVEGDAFRSGVDPIAEAKRLASNSPYRAAAVTALASDPDPMVRERARLL